jgi:multiple sugar transport system substrate-binding protein
MRRSRPFDDFAPGLIGPLKVDGALHGIPVRHATNALIYNEALLEERGVSKLPASFEELVEVARKLTFKREDGTQVHGLAFTAVFASNFLTVSRCLGGDYMSVEGKLTANEPAMVKALTILADLYKTGVLPRNFATVNNEEITTWMQQGRGGDDDQSLRPAGLLQRSGQGQVWRALQVIAATDGGRPRREDGVRADGRVLVADDPEERQAEAARLGIHRALSSKAGTTAMALNGNGADPHLDLCRREIEGGDALCCRRGRGIEGLAHPFAGL